MDKVDPRRRGVYDGFGGRYAVQKDKGIWGRRWLDWRWTAATAAPATATRGSEDSNR